MIPLCTELLYKSLGNPIFSGCPIKTRTYKFKSIHQYLSGSWTRLMITAHYSYRLMAVMYGLFDACLWRQLFTIRWCSEFFRRIDVWPFLLLSYISWYSLPNGCTPLVNVKWMIMPKDWISVFWSHSNFYRYRCARNISSHCGNITRVIINIYIDNRFTFGLIS